jgi:minor extracellular serine protease Vpr
MKRSLKTVLSALAAAALGLAAPLAMSQNAVPVEAAEGGTLWFVELSGAPVADGNTLAAVQAEKAAFRRNAGIAGVRVVERRSYDVLFNGFAVKVELRDRAKLSQIPGVKAIYPVETIAAPSPEVAAGEAADMAAAVALTGANIAQNARGLTGRGVKVGIIDTGIDIDHPAFGGNGTPAVGTSAFPTARVVSGYDFVGDAFNGSNTPVPDANPDDCQGHGTHVAGIVGANGGGIKGVAPGVSFGAYRVFGCAGSSTADVIIAAMEQAYADGMQVINQSLGAARQWPQYPTAQAASRLVNKGVVMVASIGNNGPGGSSPDALFAAGAPGVGAKVIGVASFDNAQRAFTVNGTAYGFNPAGSAPLPPTTGSLLMAKTWTGAAPNPATSTVAAPTADGCSALPAGSLTGLAVLIRRGTCGFQVKALNAQNAGAAAVILYNNQAGAINATVAGTPPITIPVVGITAAQGVALHNAIAAGPTTLTWTGDYVGYPFGTGGLISGFSSFGLAADLSLKPNIGAPGGGIFSSYPLELGGAATLSGTSMSSPHVAGGVALILEARPNIRSTAMAAWLQGSAQPKAWSGSPGLGLLDHAHRQGAGMLDIIGTLDATTVVEPSQLSLGESEAGAKTVTLTVNNDGSAAVTYALSHTAALATGPNVAQGVAPATPNGTQYNVSGPFDAAATVSFAAPVVTVPAGGSATVTATITAPGDALIPQRGIYGGYIVLTPQGAGATVRVPFAGFKGDYQSTQVLTPTANGFPWLAQASGTSYVNRNATGATYTLVGNDVPYVLMHLDHLSRRIRLEAFDAVTGKSWHRVSDDEYVTRSSTPGGFFAFAWDGTTFTGKGKNASQQYTVPNGRYVVKVSVLKALGDEANPAHWETFTTNTITIARP